MDDYYNSYRPRRAANCPAPLPHNSTMFIFFINLNGGRFSWLQPLIFIALSWLLNGGIGHILATVSSLTTWVTGTAEGPLTLLLDWLFLVGLVVISYHAWHRFAPPHARQLLRQAFFGGGGNAAGPAQARGDHAAATQEDRQQRWSKVVRVLHQLPTDVVATRPQLEQETATQLKQRLAAAGVAPPVGAVEKAELIDALLGLGGSSASSCSICCEDYVAGDVVRVLPCHHRMHLECVDRWFLSAAAEYSRAPSCPMCNTELQL